MTAPREHLVRELHRIARELESLVSDPGEACGLLTDPEAAELRGTVERTRNLAALVVERDRFSERGPRQRSPR